MLRPAVTLLGGLQVPFEDRFIVVGTSVFLPIRITHFELRDTATLFDELDQNTIPYICAPIMTFDAKFTPRLRRYSIDH